MDFIFSSVADVGVFAAAVYFAVDFAEAFVGFAVDFFVVDSDFAVYFAVDFAVAFVGFDVVEAFVVAVAATFVVVVGVAAFVAVEVEVAAFVAAV